MLWFEYTISFQEDDHAEVRHGMIQAHSTEHAADKLDELFGEFGTLVSVLPYAMPGE